MMPSRAWPDRDTFSTRRRCRTFSEVEASRLAMPSTPFIGVRISWLMVARNCDFARLAASACSRARTSSDSARFRSVMSRRMLVKKTSSPLRTSLTAISMANSVPSLRIAVSSRPPPVVSVPSVLKMAVTRPAAAERYGSGIRTAISAPTISSGA